MEKALASFGSSIISWVMNVLWRKCFRRLYKKLVHLLTGKSEIERLCNFSHENERQRFLLNLSLSILQSKQLKNVPRSMFVHKKSFAPESTILDSILKFKKISTPAGINARVEVNLLAALQQVNLVNRTIEALDRKKKEAFDSSNSSHEALLERLWASLRPGVRRAGGRVSAEWGEIGFQGQDPATDFRGMGLLGLEQLVHFAEGPQNSAARAALTDSAHPVRYYPFAAAGINLTSFVVELLGARLLDGEVHRRRGGRRGLRRRGGSCSHDIRGAVPGMERGVACGTPQGYHGFPRSLGTLCHRRSPTPACPRLVPHRAAGALAWPQTRNSNSCTKLMGIAKIF